MSETNKINNKGFKVELQKSQTFQYSFDNELTIEIPLQNTTRTREERE